MTAAGGGAGRRFAVVPAPVKAGAEAGLSGAVRRVHF